MLEPPGSGAHRSPAHSGEPGCARCTCNVICCSVTCSALSGALERPSRESVGDGPAGLLVPRRYIGAIIQQGGVNVTSVFRVLRLLRIFRVFKLSGRWGHGSCDTTPCIMGRGRATACPRCALVMGASASVLLGVVEMGLSRRAQQARPT